LTAQDLQANAQTIRNIRLWDPFPAITPMTFSQIQSIRGYYQFRDVDLDRYPLGGQLTQTELSVRELNQGALPGGKSWVNEHLQYTHGIGAVLAPANAVGVDTRPVFDLGDIPPTPAADAPADTPTISQPRVYFGEQTTNFSIVGTTQPEFDYPSPQNRAQSITSHYDGKGGVTLSSLFRRVAFALRFNDLNVLISGAITGKSKILFIRDVPARVHKAAPFLKFDADPYAVINNGRLLWVQDAYTTTDQYPYAQDFNQPGRLSDVSGLNTSFNYVRNSVKATIDAYDGSVTFYVFDPADPILRAYQKAFPNLFKPASAMPPGLVNHLRYPEDLFRVQTTMWGRYHITDPLAFYQAGDAWDVAQDPGVGATATTSTLQVLTGPTRIAPTAKRQDPFYLLLKLPGESQQSFMLFQPMVAAVSSTTSQQNMTAFMVAKGQPSDYGQIEVFTMPGNAPVPGPVQVDSLIQQDVQVSQAISLLNTNGSEVLLGNVLTIPVNQSFLYVRPLYVSSKGSGSAVPELKRVIVVYGNQVAYQNTLQDALVQLFPGAGKLTQEQTTQAIPSAPSTPSSTPSTAPTGTIASLLAQAQKLFSAANAALAKNPPDFATYEQDIQQAQQLIAQAAAQASAASSSSPTTTTPPGSTTTTPSGTSTTAPSQSAMGPWGGGFHLS
jgi:hypothetical protein